MQTDTFLRLTLSGAVRGQEVPWVKVTVRPVRVKGERRLQFSYFDGKKDISKNLAGEAARAKLEELLALPFSHIHVQAASGDLHVRITKKGKALISRGKPSRPEAEPDLAHDRRKRYPLSEADPFLQAIGVTDRTGRVRGTMRGKFHQINQFLSLLEPVLPSREGTLYIVDCGCGKAYLTFAAYHYLNDVLVRPTRVVGVDQDEEVIAKAVALRDQLAWEGMEFHVARIADFVPEARPDIVLSLHACDTATDEALAQGVKWESEVILAAPCCQHELHDQLHADLFRPVLRHGILKERMADLLTDTFRALLLRIAGYRTEVVEFVDPEHTAKNLMLRAVRGLPPGDARFLQEYQELKAFWEVTPALEGRLGSGTAALGLSEGSGSAPSVRDERDTDV